MHDRRRLEGLDDGFIGTLSLLVETYDAEHHPFLTVAGVELLRFLMDQHGLTQNQLLEVGNQPWCRRCCAPSAS